VRTHISPSGYVQMLIVLACITTLFGCKNENPAGTPPPNPDASCSGFLAWEGCALWPNEEGRKWHFNVTVEEWDRSEFDTIYVSIQDVPPIPTLDESIPSLADPAYTDPPDTTYTFTYQMSLHEIRGTPDGLGRRIAVSSDPQTQLAPLFFGPGVLLKTDKVIEKYSLDQTSVFPFLERSTSAGYEFTRQVIPALAPDVLLHARVLGRKTVTVPSGTYDNVLEVFYLLDYGVSQAVDSYGNSLGFEHQVGLVSIVFAPDVGPVFYRERRHQIESILSDQVAPRTIDITLVHSEAP